MAIFLLFSIGAYIIGSINFAIIFLKILGKKDPRTEHSRNPGTVNVYRQTGLFGAAIVLILDLIRAAVLSYLALQYLPLEQVPWIAFSLIGGNRFPCFHEFKGGKGVANYLGFTIIASPLFAAIGAVIWVVTYGVVRTTFIASYLMILTLGAGIIIKTDMHPIAVAGTAASVLFIFINHKKNIIDFKIKIRKKIN